MLFKTLSAAVYGVDANIIEVEVDVSGIKTSEDHFLTVGLPDAAVRESRERIRATLRNCGYDVPPTHITVNLAPGGHQEGGLGLRSAHGSEQWCYYVLVRNHQSTTAVTRVTISLSEKRYRALKEASARQGKTIRQIIEESLEASGIKTMREASELLERARKRAGLSDAEAMKLALRETRAARRS
jgi:hypothetical protein